MDMKDIIAQIRANAECRVFDPTGLPVVHEPHLLPEDLRQFYMLCGGVALFETSEYTISIVAPNRFELANPVIVGKNVNDDLSSSWYIIADGGNEDYLTIDLSCERPGRCYDSFWDRHGVVGSCPIIATSFTDLLIRLYESQGQYWYWLRRDFVPLGDAYFEKLNK